MFLNLEMPSEFILAIREAVRDEVLKTVSVINANSDQQLMTVSNVAEFMQVSVTTVRQFMALGLPHFQEGQVIRFLKSDVVDWTRRNPTYLQKSGRLSPAFTKEEGGTGSKSK